MVSAGLRRANKVIKGVNRRQNCSNTGGICPLVDPTETFSSSYLEFGERYEKSHL